MVDSSQGARVSGGIWCALDWRVGACIRRTNPCAAIERATIGEAELRSLCFDEERESHVIP